MLVRVIDAMSESLDPKNARKRPMHWHGADALRNAL
jgi:hypothetical protein